ncbi:hypothetical protein [Pseudarthrobacter sp. NPDC080039]|uniref:hypothetical protein n=1 Tax=unclassified Pseudarthrobacter TaxID=2647000 RepID=UPI00344E1D61
MLNPVGVRVAALGTSPLPANPHPVQLRRFKAMAEEYGLTAREQLADGTGAVRQLEVLHRTGDLQRLVEDAANCTVAGS